MEGGSGCLVRLGPAWAGWAWHLRSPTNSTGSSSPGPRFNCSFGFLRAAPAPPWPVPSLAAQMLPMPSCLFARGSCPPGMGRGGMVGCSACLVVCLPAIERMSACPAFAPPSSPPVFPPAEIAHGRFTLPSNSLSLFNRSLKRKKESFSERPNCARSLFLRPVARFFVIDGPFSVSSPFSGSTHARAAHTHPPVI